MKNRMVLLVAIGFLFGRVSFGATELLVNGGFEAISSAPWQVSQDLTTVPVVLNAPLQAHSGNNFIEMGNANGPAQQGVFQNIQVPTNTLVARFSYSWATSTGSDGPGLDQLFSLVAQGQNSITLDHEFSSNLNYQQAHFNLTGFAGSGIQLGFFLQNTNNGLGVRSFFALDDVSLLSFTADDIPANDNFTNAAVLATTTNISVLVTNVVASKETGEPKHAGNSGGRSVWWKFTAPGNGQVTINTDNTAFNTTLAVYTGTAVNSLKQVAANDDENSGRGTLTSQVKFLVTTGTEYKIAVDGKNGDSGVVQLNLSFSVDSTDPKVAISSPKSGAKLTSSTVAIKGTASDNLAVASVQFRLENAAGTNDYQNAVGTNSWTATVTNLIPGPNTIRVRALDTSSNESASVASTVTFVVVSPITVNINGSGTVTPNLNGQSLNVGSTFKMTAKPGAGQVFASWTGDVNANTAALTFIMRSNMVLNANFAPNPFIPVAGNYQGLFYDTNGPEHQSSGSFNATVASSGSYSSKIILGGKSYGLSGQFTAGGFASNNIVRKGLTPVTAQLNLDLAGGSITGVLSDGTFTAELNAGLTTKTPGGLAGRYTLLIPGSTNGVGHPGGDSYATVVVSPTGAITLSGVLADGTKVAQKANLLTTGQWPFYAALYKGNGSIFSWLTFTNDAIGGQVDWFKLSSAGGKIYPAGFTNETEASGSRYVFTKGVPVLNFATGQIYVANGNLTASFISQISLDSASKVTSTNATLKMTITTSSGLFKGTIGNPDGGKPIAFNGVVLQKQNVGGGFFTGATETGRVTISP